MQLKGIDISKHQGNIDWSKVSTDFIIMRAGYRQVKDPKFEEYYNGAKSRNIPIGAYWYTYATTPSGAIAEANACIQALSGKQFEYPIYFDAEEAALMNTGMQNVSACIQAFCDTIAKAGYYPGVYSFKSGLENTISSEIKSRYTIWVANVGVSSTTYKGHDIWQYSWKGSIKGIKGDVDLDYCYKDFPSIIKSGGYNGYGNGIYRPSVATLPTQTIQPYVPRLEAPESDNLYYVKTTKGGYNRCILRSGNTVLPNCVGYAYGRFMEIGNVTSCTLSTHNAGTWFGNTIDGYERGQEPRLGAVICWDRAGKAGHVGIVEEIHSDGSIVTSNSAYDGKKFYTQTLQPPLYTWNSVYKLQGFIYNPNAKGGSISYIEELIKEAKTHVGENKDRVLKWIQTDNKHLFSCAFVVSCARNANLLNVVIPEQNNPESFVQSGIDAGLGSFLQKSDRSINYPKAGDIVLFRMKTNRTFVSDYDCDTLGIITESKNGRIEVVMYCATDKVEIREYKCIAPEICGYYQPNWSVLNNDASLMYGYGQLGKFYDTQNTDEDATIREIGYLSDDFKPTTIKSGIRLCSINYTTLMSAVMDDLLVPGIIGGSDIYGVGADVDVSGFDNPNAKVIMQYLMGKGLNKAAAIGFCANIYHESRFDCGIVEGGYSVYNGGIGICQWTNSPRAASHGRRTDMMNFVGADWRNNLTGQLDFLWKELTTTYKTKVLDKIMAVPDTEQGARQAADIIVRKFEVPGGIETEAPKRQNTASSFYRKVTVQLTSTSTQYNSIQSSGINTSAPLQGTTLDIPTSVNQSGIVADYTNYCYWYSRWAKSSNQYRVAHAWNDRGRQHNRNISTIDGFYLVAAKSMFGTVGDKLSVVLNDGTVINCIMADAKGADAQSPYGHLFGGKVSLIEFEAFGPENSAKIQESLDLSGWKGKPVAKIINAGKYI